MNQTHLFYIVLAIVFMCFGLQMCFQRNQVEGFALSPASSPDATTYPILYEDYPSKHPAEFPTCRPMTCGHIIRSLTMALANSPIMCATGLRQTTAGALAPKCVVACILTNPLRI